MLDDREVKGLDFVRCRIESSRDEVHSNMATALEKLDLGFAYASKEDLGQLLELLVVQADDGSG